MSDKIRSSPRSTVYLRTSENKLSKCPIWVESGNFYGEGSKLGKNRYLIVGFDTEYKTPDAPLTADELKSGFGKNTILSYQVHCKVYDPDYPDTPEWSGICYPEKGSRLSLSDVLTFAFWKGNEEIRGLLIPKIIYLVGHFTRADVPTFSDFQTLTKMMSSVRNTFLSIDGHIALKYFFDDDKTAELKILVRDTMLLTPAASKSLAELGDLVGLEKLKLDEDPKKDLFYKKNMDVLLDENPVLFEKYALRDAEICVRYADQLVGQTKALLGSTKIPVTLTSIGVDLLLKSWKEDLKLDPLAVLGKEVVSEHRYSEQKGYYEDKDRIVDIEEISWHIGLATECYHGGRNEQFWFGPGFEADWTDYDLSGAYPTGMALICEPDWKRVYVSLNEDDYTPLTMGVANVEFEFPENVEFPTLPVRTDNGLIFPRKGISNCAAPEIFLAKSLGAKLKIRHGVIVPNRTDTKIFGQFIQQCAERRKSFKKGSLQELFWKEVSNASYGKTAQGLHEKRVFDLRSRTTQPLPQSKITNPFFAAYITSFVRAVLGEVINALPNTACVFSCTTDGFLTSATSDEIREAIKGPLAREFSQSRLNLSGDPTVLEIKHQIKRPLGWRTRGQATLKQGEKKFPNVGIQEKSNFVLAKGGIYTEAALDTVWSRNEYIVKTFFNRKPEDEIVMKSSIGVRDMVNFDTDLVDKKLVKRLSMEFDWKRSPKAVRHIEKDQHIAFSTKAWNSVEEFKIIRNLWERFAIETPFCLKTMDDFRNFAVFVLSQTTLDKKDSRYLRREDPDLKKLRQALGSAWRQSEAGFKWQQYEINNEEFAFILSEAGVPCKRADVENAARKTFEPFSCPRTPNVLGALQRLTRQFPDLELEQFLTRNEKGIDLVQALTTECDFLDRIQTSSVRK